MSDVAPSAPSSTAPPPRPVHVGVFASGGGTNLQALIDRLDRAIARVELVLTDKPDAYALERARSAGIRTAVVPVAGRPVEEVTTGMLDALEAAGVELIALAGYIRKVPPAVVRRFPGRILNIHPALLPAFGGQGMYGQRVHRAVLEARCRVSGVSIHLADEEYDRGPIRAQWPGPVDAGDTPDSLAARVLRTEHVLYPAVVQAVARAIREGRDVAGLRFRAEEGFAAVAGPDAAGIARALGLD